MHTKWMHPPLYVGSISNVELTRVSGFLTRLEDEAWDFNNGRPAVKDLLQNRS